MNKQIYIIDYQSGNLHSLQNSLMSLGYNSYITSDPEKILKADKLILPGIGSFNQGIENLKKNNLNEAINEYASSGKHLLGICLGMQLLFEFSEEFDAKSGLSLIKGYVKSLIYEKNFPVPHIGWNNLQIKTANHQFLKDLTINDNFYFTHSYFVEISEKIDTLIKTTYGKNNFTSLIVKDNMYGTQFHPEKSGKKGLKILRNFINL
jgi:glutamine amidotransferase|tara:strand:- start:2147 stop:2767 length:621 start_codon:yes stop_codon:yes gene_type:complete